MKFVRFSSLVRRVDKKKPGSPFADHIKYGRSRYTGFLPTLEEFMELGAVYRVASSYA